MPSSFRCLIAFGANLGDPVESLRQATQLMGRQRLEVLSVSRLHRTTAVGGPANQPDFQNAAVLAESSLDPDSIVQSLLQIEQQLGRTRDLRWAARAIDLDLLLVDGLVLNGPDVRLPHPRMTWRKFVLVPATEIAADMVHPVSGLTIGQLLDRLERMPRRIVWLDRGIDDSLQRLVASTISDRGDMIRPGDAAKTGDALQIADAERWRVLVGGSQTKLVAAANSSKLLVWDSTQWGSTDSESDWARHYPGAVMDLGLPNLVANIEIPAAMEAMATA